MPKRIFPEVAFPLVIAVLSFTFFHQSCQRGQKRTSQENGRNLRDITSNLRDDIPGLIEKLGIPGLAIALIHENEIAWHGIFGVTNSETNQPVNEETVFEAASLSKPVFSYLVLKLCARNTLDLEKPLSDYVPEDYAKKNFLGKDFDDPRYKNITARMVLNHSTGFPNWREENTIDFRSEPGREFSYSAEAFYYLQVILEKTSGQELTALMRQEVFEPLGMTQSSYVWLPEYEQNSAHRHDMMGEVRGLRRHKRALGPATLLTTVLDYARFIKALINGEGLDQHTYREMVRFQSTYSQKGFQGVDWGLGVGLEKTDEETGVWHWGDNTHAQAFFLAFPHNKTGMVYFANSFYGLAIAGEIVHTAFGGEHPVLDCGIMSPYIKLGKPISVFIQKVKNEELKAAEDYYRTNIHPLIGKESVYDASLLNTVGRWLNDNERLESAIRIFKLNLELNPGNPDATELLQTLLK